MCNLAIEKLKLNYRPGFHTQRRQCLSEQHQKRYEIWDRQFTGEYCHKKNI